MARAYFDAFEPALEDVPGRQTSRTVEADQDVFGSHGESKRLAARYGPRGLEFESASSPDTRRGGFRAEPFDLQQILDPESGGQWEDRSTPQGFSRLALCDDSSRVENDDLVAE